MLADQAVFRFIQGGSSDLEIFVFLQMVTDCVVDTPGVNLRNLWHLHFMAVFIPNCNTDHTVHLNVKLKRQNCDTALEKAAVSQCLFTESFSEKLLNSF